MTQEEPNLRAVNRIETALAIVVALVVLVAVVVFLPHFLSGSSSSATPPQLATAATESFPVTASAAGTVVPSSEEGVNFTSSGVISQIDVTAGQKVKAGTVLARLSESAAQDDVAKAQAALASAQAVLSAALSPLTPAQSAQLHASLASSQAVYNGTVQSAKATQAEDASLVAADNQQLNSDGCTSGSPSNAIICQSQQATLRDDQARQSSDQASEGLAISQALSAVTQASAAIQAASTPNPSTVASARAGVSAAQAQVAAAQNEVTALTLVSPAAGTILEVNGQIGENVTGSATGTQTLPDTSAPLPIIPSTSSTVTPVSSTSQPLIILGSPGNYIVGAAFPSSDLLQLAPNEKGTLTSTSLTGLSIPCHVLGVAQNATTLNGNSVVWASIVPDGSTSQVYDGMAVNVDVSISQANSVLAVPQSAIFLLNGVPHVDVWSGKHAVSTAVTTGLQGSTYIQITGGLTAGEQVVLSAYQGLPATATSNAS